MTDTNVHPQPPAEALEWEGVLAWLPRLAGDFEAGRWVAPPRGDDGAISLGYVELSAAAIAFLRDLSAAGVVAAFDWPAWMEAGGRQLLEADRLAGASLEDCRRLIVAIVRGDRFNEGLLLRRFEDGTLARILTRVAELRRAPPADGR